MVAGSGRLTGWRMGAESEGAQCTRQNSRARPEVGWNESVGGQEEEARGRCNQSQHSITDQVDAGKGTAHLQRMVAGSGRLTGWRMGAESEGAQCTRQNSRAHPGRAAELEGAWHAVADGQGSSSQQETTTDALHLSP
ncbi:UNVERIFIED_CONTAM: hypothetical protein FKN15_034827 [Acipenser sinensis]